MFDEDDLVSIKGKYHVPLYLYLMMESTKHGATGVVIGATGHITEKEIRQAKKYASEETLVLSPGMGKQGGEAGTLQRVFPPKNIIFSVSRGLMFPQGRHSSPQEQNEAAVFYKNLINNTNIKRKSA